MEEEQSEVMQVKWRRNLQKYCWRRAGGGTVRIRFRIQKRTMKRKRRMTQGFCCLY